jgi:hypothetical protein
MTKETLSEIQVSYKPGLISSTTTITNSQNVYEIFKSLFRITPKSCGLGI